MGMKTVEPLTNAMLTFLSQNPLCGASMSFDQIQTANEYGLATHHAGGMYVLGTHVTENDNPKTYVKMHDTWSEGYTAIVHSYDPDEIDFDDFNDGVQEFASGRDAADYFFDLIGLP